MTREEFYDRKRTLSEDESVTKILEQLLFPQYKDNWRLIVNDQRLRAALQEVLNVKTIEESRARLHILRYKLDEYPEYIELFGGEKN